MSKIYDGIIGLVVGDALGVPFEFNVRDTFKATDMVGYGTYNQPAGTWSDDSSMTLATIASIIKCENINLHDMMEKFYEWLKFGHFTAHDETFDVGVTTHKAIVKYKNDCPIQYCGGTEITDNGNGSLMRILPMAFVPCNYETIDDVSALTHAHEISKTGCKLYVFIARQLLTGKSLDEILLREDLWANEYSNIKNLKTMTRDEIKSTGYIVDTLEAALWCLLNSNTYKECVLKAVNLGGDTDTIAAVAGGLAGIMYGVGGSKGIPKKWIKQIAKHQEIKKLCDDFERVVIRK